MIQRIKNFLKRFLPPPTRAFNREIERVFEVIKEVYRQNIKQNEVHAETQQTLIRVMEEVSVGRVTLEAVREEVAAGRTALETVHTQYTSILEEMEKQRENTRALNSIIEEQAQMIIQLRSEMSKSMQNAVIERKVLSGEVEKTRKLALEGKNCAKEASWAAIFNSTIEGSTWLKNKTFFPGRWAIGYPVLYVMYRILNEVKPKRILELGLGQSTKLIAQYALAYSNTEHFVVEHDPVWIQFFRNEYELPERTKIIQLETEYTSYKEAEKVRTYKGFQEKLSDEKFDFIFIDAPLGGDMKQYSRIDVLRILPCCLAEDFVIIIDDCHRSGEKRTVDEIITSLESANIEYVKGNYIGEKESVLICSKNQAFLTSL